MMNQDYRATPEQWEKQKRRVRMQGALLANDAPCLLELLARVEALEARVALAQPAPSSPAGPPQH